MPGFERSTTHNIIIVVLIACFIGCGSGGERNVDPREDSDVGGSTDGDADVGDGDEDTGSQPDADESETGTEDTDPDAEDTDPDVETDPVDPTTDGPYGSTEETVRVAMGEGPRARRLNVHVFLPEDLSDAPYPVVIYSHGFQLNPNQYTSTATRLASHGLVAILPAYGDNMVSPLSHSQLADDVITIIDWVTEESATDEGSLHGIADISRLGAGGHSRGGKQSILAAIRDSRIIASFNVDPVDAGHPVFGTNDNYPSVTPELMDGFTIPSGFVGAGRGSSAPMGQACAPEAQNYHQYFVETQTPAFEYLLPNAGHLDFPDNCGMICMTCQAGDEPAWNRNFAISVMVSFYRVYLADDARYQNWVDGSGVTSLAPRVEFDSH